MYKRFEILLFSASFTGKKAAPEIADVSNSDIFPNGSQFSSLRLLRWFFFTFQLIEKNGGEKIIANSRIVPFPADGWKMSTIFVLLAPPLPPPPLRRWDSLEPFQFPRYFFGLFAR